nr:unnamed protein product [Digitaria exilis]
MARRPFQISASAVAKVRELAAEAMTVVVATGNARDKWMVALNREQPRDAGEAAGEAVTRHQPHDRDTSYAFGLASSSLAPLATDPHNAHVSRGPPCVWLWNLSTLFLRGDLAVHVDGDELFDPASLHVAPMYNPLVPSPAASLAPATWPPPEPLPSTSSRAAGRG